jgi:hypothetical protein
LSRALPVLLRVVGAALIYRSAFIELKQYYPHLAAPVLLFTYFGLILWSWRD